MKVVIIEDEYYASEKLKNELNQISNEIEVISVLESCDACITFFKENDEYDLVFSDIHLADGICFNIFSEIDIKAPIIFTTAYDKYALQAFETNGIDYLLKPIQPERLQKALDKFSSMKSSEEAGSLYEEIKSMLDTKSKSYKSRFLCKLGNKIKSIPVESIKYFYSKDKMTFLVDENKNRYPVNHTLDEIDKMLDPKDFIRLNRQYIAHFTSIHEINTYFKGRLKLKLYPPHDDDIVISTDRSPILKSWLDR